MTTWTRGETRVSWHAGAVLIESSGHGVLFDAPEGTAAELSDTQLGRIDAICLSSGVLRDLAGIMTVLERRSRRTERPATVVFPLGEERPSAVLGAWSSGWADVASVVQDAVHPGASMVLGACQLQIVAIGRGEPRYGASASVQPTVGLGWRVQTSDARIAIGRLPVPDGAVERLVRGVDLAIIEVGVEDWPSSDRRWRLRPDEASRIVGSADLWIVGDDGRFGAGVDQ
ncbi:MAG: hypothetical protein AB8H79_01435 [Myxococcota bacterium]